MASNSFLNRGSTTRAVPGQFTSPQAGGRFTISTPPGGFTPSTNWSSVPGVTAGPQFSSPNALLGVAPVRAVSGKVSQETVTTPLVTKPWGGRSYEERQGRGQAMFILRSNPRDGAVHTVATLPQFNDILRESYKKAVDSGIVERANIDVDTVAQIRDRIEEDMEDEVARKRRGIENKSGAQNARNNLMKRLGNVNEKFLFTNDEYREQILGDATLSIIKLMTKDGIMDSWNFLGISQNIERLESQFKVMNVAVQGPQMTDNYWADDIRQSSHASLVLKRLYDVNGDPKQFAVVPWIEKQDDSIGNLHSKYPPPSFTRYEDEAGYTQYGVTFYVGQVARVDGPTRNVHRSAVRLTGADDSVVTPELDAWAENNSNHKAQVFLTLGKAPQQQAAY